ncbi:MAG: aryl-sulfate sulfotransferase [Clostridiales bacterium]|nr:aryl-sulfate sulfotransferase [Clostridiales bacterium]
MEVNLLIIITALVVIVVAVYTAFRLGAFVYPYGLAKLAEIPKFDILEYQFKRESEILAEYAKGSYTAEAPYIIIDPYDFNPLAALILFETAKPGNAEIKIQGDSPFSTYTYSHTVEAPRAEIPVLGLYPDRANTVTLTFDGKSYQYQIATKPLPAGMQRYTKVSSKPEKMAPGITLCLAAFEHTYNTLIDCDGQVRGYFSSRSMVFLALSNGRTILSGDELKFMPYHVASLFERNWLGKIFKKYDIPNAVHHGMFELPDGNFMLASNHHDMFKTGTREDAVIILSSQTGEVIKEYDYREIADETREPYHHFEPAMKNLLNRDWLHINAVVYDTNNKAIIISSPTQSMVLSIDAATSGINWILGPHNGYNNEMKQHLLTPLGDDFEWQWCQHDPSIIPDPGDDPDIINLLLFDNGQNKSFTEEGSIPAQENYSRAVRYRINQREMTVEQIWAYGKERGPKDYATILSGAQYLGETVLIAFGGQLRKNEIPVDDAVNAAFGDFPVRSRVVEVTWDGDVVFEVSARESPDAISADTYQAKRIPLYAAEGYTYRLGEVKAECLGTSYTVKQAAKFSPPKLYGGRISVDFQRLYREGSRLIIDGDMLYRGKGQRLVRAFLVFRDKKGNAYSYSANNSFYGRFLASIDLSELPPAEYQLSVAGGIIIGDDALSKDVRKGYYKTKYKITVRDEKR